MMQKTKDSSGSFFKMIFLSTHPYINDFSMFSTLVIMKMGIMYIMYKELCVCVYRNCIYVKEL